MLPGLSAWPKSPQLGALWGQDARATRLPCASRDARQSRRSEELCCVKGRDIQCPGLGPHPTVSPRWLPCDGAGSSLRPHLQALGPARGSGVPGCLLAGVPAEKDPQRGEGPKKGWVLVLGAPACRGRTGGGGLGPGQSAGAEGGPAPEALELPQWCQGWDPCRQGDPAPPQDPASECGHRQACPAPDLTPSLCPLPTAAHGEVGQRIFMAPPRRSLWGGWEPQGGGRRGLTTHTIC